MEYYLFYNIKDRRFYFGTFSKKPGYGLRYITTIETYIEDIESLRCSAQNFCKYLNKYIT